MCRIIAFQRTTFHQSIEEKLCFLIKLEVTRREDVVEILSTSSRLSNLRAALYALSNKLPNKDARCKHKFFM